MKTLWEGQAQTELLTRAGKLCSEATAQWGKLDCGRMLTHVTDGLRMAAGDLKVAAKTSPLRFTPIKQLIIYWLPFPKGAPTAPELLERTPGEWEREIAAFQEAVKGFVARRGNAQWPEHPAFGKLSEKDWGVLMYRHIDHHFKQFGV